MLQFQLFIIILILSIILSHSLELFIDYKLDVSQYNITSSSTNYEIPFVYPSFKQCDNQWGNDLMVTKVSSFITTLSLQFLILLLITIKDYLSSWLLNV